MDSRLKSYYERELRHLREMGGEFSREFPAIAGRLGMDGLECADPYVERLLEGFAFLTARVNLKLDSEFPRFTQGLLETVYPHYLAPTPSMAMVQFNPDFRDTALAEGAPIPRQRALKSGKVETSACEYRTAHDVTLWPIEIVAAEYAARSLATLGAPAIPGAKAGIRLRIRAAGGIPFKAMKLDKLPIFLRGTGAVPGRLYEQIFAHTIAMSVHPARMPPPWQHVAMGGAAARNGCIRAVGFDDAQSLLPFGPRSFHGYRLLHEYFVMPQRFMFAELQGLRAAMQKCDEQTTELDIVLLLKEADNDLETAVSADNFQLFCTPAVNLFPKRADRIHISDRFFEFHVVADRTRPLDYEVWDVAAVQGFSEATNIVAQDFLPFYAAYDDGSSARSGGAFFSVNRLARTVTKQQRPHQRSKKYIGSEVYISLVDSKAAPYSGELKQLGIELRCTNRDLPIRMTVGRGATDFTMDEGGPVDSIRVLGIPTDPRESFAMSQTSWRVISHLSLNYLSICDSDSRQGAAALRDLLKLYSDHADAPTRKQIEGVRSVKSTPIVRRVAAPGPIAFARGLEIAVTLEEAAFDGIGPFVLGAVLDHFFAKYVSLNSFTETVVRTTDRNEIMRWPSRTGLRQIV